MRPAVKEESLPNAGPAIRVVSTPAGGTSGVRWKVRDPQGSGGVVTRDTHVQAASELQLHDPRANPFGDGSPPRELPISQVADETSEPASDLPPTPTPSVEEPSLEPPARTAPRSPATTDEPNDPTGPAEPTESAEPPSPRRLEEPLRTIPMGPPGTVPPKSLPAPPPRQLAPPGDRPDLPDTAPPRSPRPPADSDAGPPADDAANLPLRNAAYCRRLYNERNCCTDENACNEHRAHVKAHPLSRISLDITPTCNLTSRQEGNQGQCGFPFEQSPSRVWRDRKGKEMARGRVTAIANLRVEVTDDDGKSVRIRVRDLGEDDICFLAAWCGVPSECRLDDVALAARNWTPITMTWKASGLCHKPLYFEEEQLERYGHTTGPLAQPIISGAHFFLNIALLPYNAGIHPPNECQYALGYYRPGSCAPYMIPPFPLSVRGAMAEAGVALGAIYLIP
ncbi:MAG: hypothetical protein U0935_22740 [Pirellulales bacterium]